MSDPKYQNLPYMAVGQPDAYESADLPESDQPATSVEQDPAIEQLVVDPKEAFEHFNKTTIDGTKANFSEEAAPGKVGYTVYYDGASMGERLNETVQQRLERLRAELKEIKDLAKIRTDEVSPKSMLTDVEAMQREVEAFSLAPIASSDKDTMAYGQLLTQLKNESTSSPTKKPKDDGKGEAGHTTYELQYIANVSQSAASANLESRLARIEAVIGNVEDTTVLSDRIGAESVVESMTAMSSKLHLLDEDNVNKLSARLQILLQTLNKVSSFLIHKLELFIHTRLRF